MSEEPTGRSLPHSIDAEEHLLSCIVMDGAEVIPKCVAAKITPSSFYEPKHGVIYGKALDLFGANKPVDIAVIAEELKTEKMLDYIGGYPFLMQISSKVPTIAQAAYFMEKVSEQALLRSLIVANTSIVEECYAYSGDMSAFVSTIQNKFTKTLHSYADDNKVRNLQQICDKIKANAVDMLAGKSRGDENDLSWGLNDADKYLKKFRRGELVCLAARPGIGKSSLMRQVVIRNVIRDSKNVCVFTLEVDAEEYVNNTAQALTGVNVRDIKNAFPTDQQAFLKWLDRIGTFKDRLHIHDVNASLAAIIANVRIHHARHPVDMVVIDYLQLINEGQAKGENRDQLLGRMTRALKLLANELKCVVIILSQLNRSVERDDRQPHLSDLRESGNIEQDCDRVVFIYRPKTTPEGATQDFDDETVRFFYCEFLQRKGRNVGENSLGIKFERNCARFIPLGVADQS